MKWKWNNILDKDHVIQKTIGYFKRKGGKGPIEQYNGYFQNQSGIGTPGEKNYMYAVAHMNLSFQWIATLV